MFLNVSLPATDKIVSGITENYYIIVEQPLSISLPSLMASKLRNEPLAGAFRWYGDEYVSILVFKKISSVFF